jgi:hypothetical protein
MPTRQFRSVGPAVLPNPTEAELRQLRQAVGRRIKHLQLTHCKDHTLIVAQAHEKLSAKAWRSYLGQRVESLSPLQKGQDIPPPHEVFGHKGRIRPNTGDPASDKLICWNALLDARDAFLTAVSKSKMK